jgi:MFS family permease
MLSLTGSVPGIAAPLLAGGLVLSVGLESVLAIDIVTFVFALFTLLFVAIPQPKASRVDTESKPSIWKESLYGFRYLSQHPSLQGLLLAGALMNAFFIFGNVVVAPMLLARTNTNAGILGVVEASFGVGGVCGGVLISLWGGPQRKIIGMVGGLVLLGLSTMFLGLGQNVMVWATAAFLIMCVGLIVNETLYRFMVYCVSDDKEMQEWASYGTKRSSTRRPPSSI